MQQSLINKDQPFLPLYTRASTYSINHDDTNSTVSKYIITSSSTNNPMTIHFNDPFYQIDHIEVAKSRIERSEHTCESHRNCPFITLFTNVNDMINDSNKTQFLKELGVTNMTYTALLETMEYQLTNNTQSDRINLTTNFIYNYTNCNMRTFWSDYPNIWTGDFDNKWNNCDLWTYFNVGIAPFVLDVMDYSIETLTSSLNHIATTYDTKLAQSIPLITTLYNTDMEVLYFQSETPFYLIPSNAYEVVGLSPDNIYVSQFNIDTGKFTVYADCKPNLNGPDVIYIQNEESQWSMKNPELSALSTIYIQDQYNNANIDINITESLSQPIQMQGSITNKLTFTLYSDIKNKLLYQTNKKKWHMDLCITGRV